MKATTTGKRLTKWREDAGMRLDEAAVYASTRLPHRISRETIRRYENNYRPDQMDPLVLVALLDLYGKKISDLPAEAQVVVDKARTLFASASPWITANPSDLLVCAVSAA